MRVNSSHHQSVKDVAPSLQASALAPDGIIEAIESPSKRFMLGIQWHPEFLFDHYPRHRRLFEAFLEAARRRKR
jgi:putative glutamine amidotransferase